MDANNLKSNIPTHELTVGGDTIVFYDYLTTGESRELQKLLLSSGKFNTETSKIEDISMTSFLDIQDKSAAYVIKEIKIAGAEGTPFNQEWLNGLPVNLGNAVYEEINRITQVSQLTSEEKKN
ncbi:MAG TPA: hypothetical protein VJL10_10695 [Anaerolineales bacterium]|nr:hypothetical protein [Anaerolineales bacterium]